LQQHGHKPLVLIGGATTKVGDPTGKEEMRKYLDDDEIEQNIAGIKKSLAKFITFGDGPSDAIMLNNSDWLEKLGYIEFLRDCGRMFSVNKMLTMDSVRLRLEREQSLSFLEFNYMLLQAYDFYHLKKEFHCDLQLGGSDQWGNIITGVELIRKMMGEEAFGLTTPLLTTAAGTKMGKSISGAVWINEDQLSPYEYYQFWRNIADADVIKFARLYSEFSAPELIEFENIANTNINQAKKQLAHKVTAICHGMTQADIAAQTAISVFEKGMIDDNLPTIFLAKERLCSGIAAYDLLVEAGLVTSKGEGRRLIRGKGAKINDDVIQDENLVIDDSFALSDVIKLSSGKKKHVLIKISG
jgi:tyrosyl-tRNA synthetase